MNAYRYYPNGRCVKYTFSGRVSGELKRLRASRLLENPATLAFRRVTITPELSQQLLVTMPEGEHSAIDPGTYIVYAGSTTSTGFSNRAMHLLVQRFPLAPGVPLDIYPPYTGSLVFIPLHHA